MFIPSILIPFSFFLSNPYKTISNDIAVKEIRVFYVENQSILFNNQLRSMQKLETGSNQITPGTVYTKSKSPL